MANRCIGENTTITNQREKRVHIKFILTSQNYKQLREREREGLP